MTTKAKDLFKKKIREILDNGEEVHSGHPAVLSWIQRLSASLNNGDLDLKLIMYCSRYFDRIYEICSITRSKLTKILGSAGFSFMTAEFSTVTNTFDGYDEEDFSFGDFNIHDYVTLRCKFVFMNKKTYENLELMTSFNAGKTCEATDGWGNMNIYNWADNALVLPFDSMSVYTLNKMIARPECASKRLRELLPEITSMFSMETRRDS
jgi:hypothetical protein